MKKIMIHIGTGKTGSASIQKTMLHLSKNNFLLENYGIIYPLIFNQKSHGMLNALYKPFTSQSRGIKSKYAGNEKKFNEDINKYKVKFSKILHDYNFIIISSEFLANLNNSQIIEFKKTLDKSGFSNFQILIYVREPSAYYLSRIQQHLKASSKVSDPSSFKYPFKKQINRWERVFDNQIIVRPFDRNQLYHGCVVQDFLYNISNYFNSDIIDHDIDIHKTNESISAEGMFIAKKYRQIFYPNEDDVFKDDSTNLIRILKKSQNHIIQTKPKIQQWVHNIIIRNHIEDLAWLKENYGVEFGVSLAANDYPTHTEYNLNGNLEEILLNYDFKILENLLYYSINQALQ